MKLLRELLETYTVQEIAEELGELVSKDGVFDEYSGGYSKSSWQEPEWDTDNIDLGKELGIMSRNTVLENIVWDQVPYIKSNSKFKMELNLEENKEGKMDIFLGASKLSGTMKTDFLIEWIDRRAKSLEYLGGDSWSIYVVDIHNMKLQVSFSEGGLSSVKVYNPSQIYYKQLVRKDGSRRNYHRFLSKNRTLNPQHEMFGDQGAGLGSIWDDEVLAAYEEAKEIVEAYEDMQDRYNLK